MNKDILRSAFLVFILLCINLPFLLFQVHGEGFDIVITDSENDVEDMDSGKVQGCEYIDILELKSSENLLKTQVILELTVKSVITDSESITYTIEILDGGNGVYGIYYSNGLCMGTNYDEGNSDVLQSSGSGTSTLEIKVQESDLGEISEFNMSGYAMEYEESSDRMLIDWIPDMNIFDEYPYYELPLMICEPKPNATTSGTKIIEGICESSLSIESVEIQIDSMEDSGWKVATSTDNWRVWEYSWDTTTLSDGKHSIHARGYNGSEYFYDSISVYIDQSNALSPKTTDVPLLKIGLELHYTLDLGEILGMDFSDENYDMTSKMILRVIKKEKTMVEGIEYEVYNVQTITEMNITMSYDNEIFTTSSVGKGTQWIRVEDLATVKTIMRTTNSMSGFTETSVVETTYEPPMDSYNFPMSVAETWTNSFTELMEQVIEYDGEEDTYSESYDANIECEVLHYADIDVPAGTFGTYAIWSKEISGEYLGSGSPFVSPMDGYSINYYSPELGFPVKTEIHHDNRELYMVMELTSYSENGGVWYNEKESQGDELPFYFLLIPIVVVLIIVFVLVVRKRKKGLVDITGEQYPAGTNFQGQTELPTSNSYPQPFQAQVMPASQTQFPQQGSSQKSTPRHSYTPPPPPSQVQHSRAQVPISSQNVTPIMQIKCPKCLKTFNIQSTSSNVQCPFCGIKGRL